MHNAIILAIHLIMFIWYCYFLIKIALLLPAGFASDFGFPANKIQGAALAAAKISRPGKNKI
jgi:hypothetical protein